MFRPLNGKVLVRVDPEACKAGAILLPDVAKRRPRRGVVVASDDVDVRTGDKVHFVCWAGTEVNVDGETLYLMKVGPEILAVEE